jgi:hypothetical protein
VVGWYEHARLHGEWLGRPDSTDQGQKVALRPAYDWSCCITIDSEYFILPEEQTLPFSEPSVKQDKYSLLEVPDIAKTDNKERVLAHLKKLLIHLTAVVIHNPNEYKIFDPELNSVDHLRGFGSTDHRKAVELASERTVIAYYTAQDYSYRRTTNVVFGYDLIFSRKDSELHFEAKGTAGAAPRFFLKRNEQNTGLVLNPDWRLTMVTLAQSDMSQVKEYNPRQVKEAFNLEPLAYIDTFAATPKSAHILVASNG